VFARLAALSAGRRSRWAVIGIWVAVAAAVAPLQPALQERAEDESDTFLVRGSESAAAERVIERRFRDETAAVVAYVRDGGLTSADRDRMLTDGAALCRGAEIPALIRIGTPYGLSCGRTDPLDIGPGASLSTSSDASVGLMAVLVGDDSTPVLVTTVEAIRSVVPPPEGDRTGLRAYVTGEAGFEADRSAAVEGIDETLLAVTGVALLLLLLAIYRSPVVAVVPLVVVVLAYLVAAGVTFGFVEAGLTSISGQTTAILIVLMFGAGTDYCLLIVARYRDELRAGDDPQAAMVRTTVHTGPAILSAGAIVVVAMLTLALADFNATREMGPILALGVAIMVAAGLTLLPAILAATGRVAPARSAGHPLWRSIGERVRRRPGAIAAAVTLLLVAGALGNLEGREPLSFSEAFRDPPESVAGQRLIGERFIPGRAAPTQIVAPLDAAPAVIDGAMKAPGRPVQEAYLMARSIESDAPPLGLADAFLAADPFSDAAADAIPGLRAAARAAAPGEEVLIGGESAEAYDTREALARDTLLIVPITLVLVLLVLGVLLRAVVMPLYVMATVVLSFAFALGASSLLFTHVLGQPGSDASLTLFAFIFLVALGVDYNVFLLARIREERAGGAATPEAVTAALERTGGVITSAGLVLAVTFGVLMALPLESLFQVGFVVALGLLADTFLVRALLVPALAIRVGERSWWPSSA
jgi:putative drug exporter of the RND superfamily